MLLSRLAAYCHSNAFRGLDSSCHFENSLAIARDRSLKGPSALAFDENHQLFLLLIPQLDQDCLALDFPSSQTRHELSLDRFEDGKMKILIQDARLVRLFCVFSFPF